MALLGGLHDREGAFLVPPDGWILDTVALKDNPAPFDYNTLRPQNRIARLNWGYGSAGTLPVQDQYLEMAHRAADYVSRSPGCHRWIIGNETNLPREWPDGIPISPDMYAQCYTICRQVIKSIPSHSGDEVLVAGPGPWNNQYKYPGNLNGDWVKYFIDVNNAIGRLGVWPDGFSLHAYCHGYDPALARSEARMDAPFQDRHYHFRVYRDFLEAVPATLRHLPVYIAEANGDGPWEARGLMPAMLDEIADWNKNPQHQKIRCVIFYRYPKYDQYHIEGKPDVIAEFNNAMALGHPSPEVSATATEPAETFTPSEDTFIPFASTGTSAPTPAPSPHPELDWDERLTKRGIVLTPYKPNPGEQYFKLIKGEYWEEKEHTFAETLDGNGDRLPGVTLVWWWGAGGAGEREEKKTELKPGDRWMVDFPMYNAGRSYGLRTRDIPGDQLFGMGLGSVEQPDWNIHVSYKFTFMLVTAPTAQPQPEEPVVTTPASTVPKLVHPVADPRYRTITQRFGPSSIDYSIYKVDGVPLKGHNGIDFGTPIGTPIAAVASGRVVEVADEGNKGYGKYIKLVHEWGESLYAHLSEQRVRVHEQVTAGQEIGRSGNTGHSTGAHLHFGLRVWPFNRQDGWGGYTDPLPYLSGTAQSPEPAPASPSPTNARILQLIKEAAAEFGLDWRFVASLAWHESSWIINATSPAGAMGIMQLMPRTWAEQSVKVGATNPYDERDNIRTGTRYLKWLLDQLKGHEWRAVVAYNFGIGNVTQGVEPPAETVEHANRVIRTLELLEAIGV